MRNDDHFCFDIDNTIAQSDDVMREVIARVTKNRVKLDYEDVVTFNYYECRDLNGNRISKEEWSVVHSVFSDEENLLAISASSGAVEGLRKLSDYGTIHLATSRLPKARKATIEWLEQNRFPTHDLHFFTPWRKACRTKKFRGCC